MEITSLHIKGFKNLKDVSLSLGDFTALISYNNYGKSNVLEAIHFAFDFIGSNSEQKARMLSTAALIPLNAENSASPFSFEFGFRTILSNKMVVEGEYGFSCSWRTMDSLGAIKTEYLRSKDADVSQKLSLLISREDKESFYRSSQTGRCDKPIKVNPNELVLNKLLAFDDLYYHELLSSLFQIKIYLDRHFDVVRPFEFSPFISDPGDMLSMSAPFGYAGWLYGIHERYRDDFDLIVHTIKDIFPMVETLKVDKIPIISGTKKNDASRDGENAHKTARFYDLADFVYVASVTMSNLVKPVNISQMSDGFKRILLILTGLKVAKYNHYSLLCVEEPENSINPSLLRRFLTYLHNFAEPTQIIVTSHSPFLVNYLPLQDVYLGLPDPNGFASFRKIRSQSIGRIEDNAKAMDMPTGEYLFDVLSGDEEGLSALEKYLEK